MRTIWNPCSLASEFEKVMAQWLVLPYDSEDTSYGALAGNLVLELALFAISECIVRPCFRQNFQNTAHERINMFKLLITQEILLLLSVLVVLVFHHTPYILIAAALAVLFRAIQEKYHTPPIEASGYHRPAVSKPIRHGSSVQGFHKQHSVTIDQAKLKHSTSVPYTRPEVRQRLQSSQFNDSGATGSSHSVSYLTHRRPITGSNSLLGRSPVHPHVSHRQLTQVVARVPQEESTSSRISQGESTEALHPSVEHLSLGTAQASSSPHVQFPTMGTPSEYSYWYSLDGKGYDIYTGPSTAPPGLINRGNTCFVNSTLQCLNWTPGFVGVLPKSTDPKSEASVFLSKLNSIFLLLNRLPDGKSKFVPISTTELLSSTSLLASHLVAPLNSVQHQQDTAEYLLWLLDHLHCALRAQPKSQSALATSFTDADIEKMKTNKSECIYKIKALGSHNLSALSEPMSNLSKLDWDLHWHKHSSTLYELFLGQILEARACQNCNKVTVNTEYFTLLPLPIPLADQGPPSLNSCFNIFSKIEELVEDNMISCSCVPEGCLAPATRLALLSSLPKSLIIQLTRFSYDSVIHTAVKNSSPLYFPQSVDFFTHTMKAMLDPAQKHQSMVYELYAFCVHSGAQTTSYGHYAAYCKAADGQWYHFNDVSVTHVKDIEKVLSSEFVLHNAYLLFYHHS